MKRIKGGATIWARQTIESDIFYWKPDKWFKIWFFIVNKMNHQDTRLFVRGTNFTTYDEISKYTKATKNQIDSFVRFAKEQRMMTTHKTTRGMVVTVINYAIYQDLKNYKTDTETETQPKHNRNTTDTINKNDKNDKLLGEEKSSQLSKKDMGWKHYNENEHSDDIPSIGDNGEIVKPKEKEKRHYKEVYEVFKKILGVSPLNWTVNVTQQKSAENLYTERGVEQIEKALLFYNEYKDVEFCPHVTTPYDLDSKWSKLNKFKKQNGY